MSRDYLNSFLSTQAPGVRNNTGIGYVIIKAKNNTTREKYIKDCVLKGCVTIALENGGFVETVPVLKHVWNYIEFPEKENQMGSCVSWRNVDKRNIIIIDGVLPKINEMNNIAENQFVISRAFTKKVNGKQIQNYLEISGDAKAGKINISIDGGMEDGELLVNVFNKNKSASAIINIQGKFNLISSDEVSINSAKKIILGKGKEKSEGITLGKQTQKVIDAFIDQMAKSTVTTALGTMPLLNTAQIILLKKNTSKIISQYSFTD